MSPLPARNMNRTSSFATRHRADAGFASESRALYPADRKLTGADRGMAQTDWRERYSMLCAGTVDEGQGDLLPSRLRQDS
jgi:hypothetical protein